MINKIKKLFKMYILKDKFTLAHRMWVRDNGNNTKRLIYDLNKDSIVFDIGGYHGEFAEKIFYKYQCTIYIFEPVPSYYKTIVKKFENIDKVKVYNFGLSNKNNKINIDISNDASSIYKKNTKSALIELRSIIEFLEEEKINYIDLLKINIEGGEFDILPQLIETSFIKNITDLQIQFHDFIQNAKEKREAIRSDLYKTHNITYDYYFVWENWSKKCLKEK